MTPRARRNGRRRLHRLEFFSSEKYFLNGRCGLFHVIAVHVEVRHIRTRSLSTGTARTSRFASVCRKSEEDHPEVFRLKITILVCTFAGFNVMPGTAASPVASNLA